MSRGLNVIKAEAARKRVGRLPVPDRSGDLSTLVEEISDWGLEVGEVRREPVPVPVDIQRSLASHVNCKDNVRISSVGVRREAKKAERMEGPVVRVERPKEVSLLERTDAIVSGVSVKERVGSWNPSRVEMEEILGVLRLRQKSDVPCVSPTGLKIRESLQRKMYERMVITLLNEKFPGVGNREIHRRTGMVLSADNVFKAHYSHGAVHRKAVAIRSANATRANEQVMQFCKRRGWVRPDNVEEASEVCSVATCDESEADSYGRFRDQEIGEIDEDDREIDQKEDFYKEKRRDDAEAYGTFLDHYGD